MQRPQTRSDLILHYASWAATAVKDVADSRNVPFMGTTAALCQAIFKLVESVKTNITESIAMVEQIHAILCAIMSLYSTSETNGALPPAILYNIARFTETLQRIYTFLKTQQGIGKIKRIFRHLDSSSQLAACKKELEGTLEVFGVHTGVLVASKVSELGQEASERHEELVALISANPELAKSEYSSNVTGTMGSFGDSSGSLSMLPSPPQIFHGRDSELEDIVALLPDKFAHIVLLGTGGMGKTTLALASLHHPKITETYSNRYFVACHSLVSASDLARSIADHIGCEKGGNASKKIVNRLSQAAPSLLVLDNFETPWEPIASRGEIEDFLSLLSEIPQLAILITMRGAERPAKVKWSRPFLPPLKPLSDDAALETFLDIADDNHDEATMKQLLEVTGNLPLAVSLIAGIVADEGCEKTLLRWKSESTHLLSDGFDKRSSLDISIMLSFSSARMSHEAQDLLSLLSMLPDGLRDSDLVQSGLPITNVLAAKATLLQTSLAYLGKNQHLTALVPIREFVGSVHPPQPALKFRLRQHFHKILEIWGNINMLRTEEMVNEMAGNLGNLNALLLDALTTDSPDQLYNLKSTIFLVDFYHMTNRVIPPPLVAALTTRMEEFSEHPIYGYYIIQKLLVGVLSRGSHKDIEDWTAAGNKHFKNANLEEQIKWYSALSVYHDRHNEVHKSQEYQQIALAKADELGVPTLEARKLFNNVGDMINLAGKPTEALVYAQRAQRYAEELGDMVGQARALQSQSSYQVALGNFKLAKMLNRNARDLLEGGGLKGGQIDILAQQDEAEIYLLKTEYAQARKIHHSIATSGALGRPGTFALKFSDLNIALIDILIGADLDAVER
ncbi:P-loop containing nucleoside triphosphate hydrolase protein, partial [Mycena filopes]